MRRIVFLLSAIVLIAGQTVFAQNITTNFEEVKSQYQQKNYEVVAKYFDNLAKKGKIWSMLEYKMAWTSYRELAETMPAKRNLYNSKADSLKNAAVKWLGKKIVNDRWAGIDDLTLDQEQDTFTIVDIDPEYPGGTDALYKFLAANIEYPEAAQKKGVEGNVFVQFVINTDGSIDGINAIKGIGAGCDEEAVRVVNTMPDWLPGMNDGKPVAVRMVLPLSFVLNDMTGK